MGYIYQFLKKEQKYVHQTDRPDGLEIAPPAAAGFADPTRIAQRDELRRDFYLLKENLATIRSEYGKKIFAFTGPRAGVGVSSIVAYLSFTWAKSLVAVPGDLKLLSGKRILVIDTNVNAPSLNRFFKLSAAAGLTDYLTGRIKIDRAITRLPGNNLFFIPAGQASIEYEETFASTQFMNLMNVLREKFDVILVDTPPVLHSSESIPLIKAFRNYLVVIDAQRTPTGIAKKAIEQLKFYNAEILGVIMNRRRYYVPAKIYNKL